MRLPQVCRHDAQPEHAAVLGRDEGGEARLPGEGRGDGRGRPCVREGSLRNKWEYPTIGGPGFGPLYEGSYSCGSIYLGCP